MKQSDRTAATRTRVLNAARHLLATEGVDATTIRAVARAADVGVGTVLLHVGSKQELLQAVWRDATWPTVQAALREMDDHPGPWVDTVLVLYGALIRHYAGDRALARAVFKELPFLEGAASKDHLAHLVHTLDALTEATRRAADRGEVSATVPPDTIAHTSFTLHFGALLRLLSPSPTTPDDALAELTVQLHWLQRGAS